MTRTNLARPTALALCAVIWTGAAFAADLPVKAPVLAPSVYNWTGIYVGGHFGYGIGMKDWVDSSFDYDVKGFLGGGQIGVNQQIGNWVIGIEADASWASVKGSQTLTIGGPIINLLITGTAELKVDRFVTVAGRIGFAQDRWLVYAKLGAAWAHENHAFGISQTQTIPGAAPALLSIASAAGENRFGPMLGFGTEYAFWGNWSLKTEYNYVHFTTGLVQLAGTATTAGVTTPFTTTMNLPQAFHLTKIGLNYRFGPDGAPSIAPSRPVPGYNWTGSYVGAVAGYGFGRKTWPNFAPNGVFDAKGWLAGGTVGTNVQAGVFVLGVESEWMWTGVKGSSDFTISIGAPDTQATGLSSKIDWLSLTSLRAGFVAADRWLVYAKGGIALARETHSAGIVQNFVGTGTVNGNFSGNALHTGYLAGIGIEHAFLNNWSAKLEYNYINFRRQDVSMTGASIANIPGTAGTILSVQRGTIQQEMHLVKFGVNYHFNVLDIVTAKY